MISDAEIKDIMLKILEEKEKNMITMKMYYSNEHGFAHFQGQNIAYTKVYKLLKKVVYGDE